VKYWLTINDPWQLCNVQFGNALNPMYNDSGVGNCLCGHHVLLAHAKVYRIYNDDFRWIENGNCYFYLITNIYNFNVIYNYR
jgi:beta-glucosidase/6-phospho-beta-glucosidase/beta-galactosidase